jgi:hypothetical protein
VPSWEYAQTASIGVEAPVSKILPPANVVVSSTSPSVADAGPTLPNFHVAGLAPVVARRSNWRVESAGRICVAVAGANVKEVVVTVSKFLIQYVKDEKYLWLVRETRRQPMFETNRRRTAAMRIGTLRVLFELRSV